MINFFILMPNVVDFVWMLRAENSLSNHCLILQDAGTKSTGSSTADSKGSLNLSKVFPRPASSPSTLKHKRSASDGMIIDEKTRTASDSGVELTPVEKFNSSSEGSGSTANGSRKASLE